MNRLGALDAISGVGQLWDLRRGCNRTSDEIAAHRAEVEGHLRPHGILEARLNAYLGVDCDPPHIYHIANDPATPLADGWRR